MRRLALVPLLIAAGSLLASASVDEGLLALVPPGSSFIAGIDVDRTKSSEFWQFVTSKMQMDNKEFADFVQQTNFDPRRDLQQVILAGFQPAAGQHDPRFAVLARGNFDQQRLEAAAKQKGCVAHNVDGVELFRDKSQPGGGNAFAFLGAGIGAMGDEETVRQIIANRATANTLDAAMQTRVAKTGADNDIWFVSSVSGAAIAHQLTLSPSSADNSNHSAPQPVPQAQVLESVQSASGGLQFGDTIRVTFDAVTRSAKDATSMADVVRFFASMVQMQRQKDPRAEVAADAFDKMELATDGDTVHVSLAFPEKSLEKLVGNPPIGIAMPSKQ